MTYDVNTNSCDGSQSFTRPCYPPYPLLLTELACGQLAPPPMGLTVELPLLLARWSIRRAELSITMHAPLSVMLVCSHKHSHSEQLKYRIPRNLQCCCGLKNWLNKLVICMAYLHLGDEWCPETFGSTSTGLGLWWDKASKKWSEHNE